MNDFQKPWLVLGIGNRLLGDDAVGLIMLEQVALRLVDQRDRIDFIDGGTQGLALLGHLEDRKGILILDAIALGESPGSVHTLDVSEVTAPVQNVATAHGSSAKELLNTAMLLGQLPENIVIVGIEPERVATGIGLSAAVENSIEPAVHKSISLLAQMMA